MKQSPWLIACLLTWAACDPSQTTGPSTVFDLRMSSSTDMASTDLAMMTGVVTVCEECQGKRFQAQVLEYKLNDKDISEVLAMSASEAT